MSDIISQLVDQIEAEEVAKEQAALGVKWAHLENLILNPVGWWLGNLAQDVWIKGGDEGEIPIELPIDFWEPKNKERREKLEQHVAQVTRHGAYFTRNPQDWSSSTIYWKRSLIREDVEVD